MILERTFLIGAAIDQRGMFVLMRHNIPICVLLIETPLLSEAFVRLINFLQQTVDKLALAFLTEISPARWWC